MSDLISRFLAPGPPKRVAVLGDLLVDENYQAVVTRVAPEAPVPVMRSTHAPPTILPGGAGNVARQFDGLRPLGVTATLVAPCDDGARATGGGRYDRCVDIPPGGRLPVKRRWYQGDRLLFRHDVQDEDYGLAFGDLCLVRQRLMYAVSTVLEEGVDALVLSDYAGGALDPELITWVIGRCKYKKVPVFVDPKRRPFGEWRGCTALKLNASELNGHTPTEAGREADAQCVVVTHADAAPLVASRAGSSQAQLLPVRMPNGVRCVSGAGDCFLAYFVAARLKEFSWEEAAAVAHAAGRVYVGGFDNLPVYPEDLRRAADPVMGKLVPASFVRQVIPIGERLVFANGVFDVALHSGHIRTLEWARRQGRYLVVGLNSDASVRRLKGEGRPADPQDERAFRLACLDCVDLIVIFEDDTPEALMREVMPDVLVKGFDYAGKRVPGDDLCELRVTPDFGCRTHSSDFLG